MQNRASFYEGFKLRGLPYYKQRELLANTRPLGLGYESQVGGNAASKFRNHIQLKDREDWLLHLGLGPTLAHDLAKNTMEHPDFNLQQFQQRWHELCQHFGGDRCTEANTIVLREIRELMQSGRGGPIQRNLQQGPALLLGNLPIPCGLEYPTNSETLKYINELALYQRRTSTPLCESSNVAPHISPTDASLPYFEAFPAMQKYNSNSTYTPGYTRPQNFHINTESEYQSEDAYNIDTDPRNVEEVHPLQPPEYFSAHANNFVKRNYDPYYNNAMVRNDILCENVAGKYQRQNQRFENNYNCNNVNYPHNNPYRNENGYNYNLENRRRNVPEYDRNKLSINLENPSRNKEDYANNDVVVNRPHNYKNENGYFKNTIGHLRGDNEYNINNIVNVPREPYKSGAEFTYKQEDRRNNIRNDYRLKRYNNIPNEQRIGEIKYSNKSEKEGLKYDRRESEKSDSRDPPKGRKRLAEPINKPELRPERKRRLEDLPTSFRIGNFRMPYLTQRTEPLPQPERKSYAIDFCQRKHVFIIGDKNADRVVNNPKELLPMKYSRQACKSTRKILRFEWAKIYQDNDYSVWLKWWKDFKWCHDAIKTELKKFNGLNLGKEIFFRDTQYYDKPHSVDVLLRKANETLQVNVDNARTILSVLFELMNERFLEKLSPTQMGELQDMLRYYPNSTWVYKMRFMIYLWARCNNIQLLVDSADSPRITPDMDRQIYSTQKVWNGGDFHWLAKQAYDELISISEYEWPEHKNIYPIL